MEWIVDFYPAQACAVVAASDCPGIHLLPATQGQRSPGVRRNMQLHQCFPQAAQ
jgi:hypothetical protein